MSTNALWITLWSLAGAVLGMASTLISHRLAETHRHHRAVVSAAVGGIATAILFGLLAWRLAGRAELAAYSCLAAFAVPLAAIDIAEHRLPSRLVGPLCAGLLISFGVAAVLERNGEGFVRALAGMVVLSAGYLVVAVASRGGLGAGDVRLAAPVGLALAWRDWPAVATGTVVGLLVASVMLLTTFVRRRAVRPTPIPFGPAMLAGAFVAVLG